VKSSDFEEFFENLLYSIEGQLGSESIILFSKKTEDAEGFEPLAIDGVDLEADFKILPIEPIFDIVQNLEGPQFTKKIPSEGLPEKDWSILNNPFTEVITPIKNEDLFLGFIITGKLLSGEEYKKEDLEFLKLISELAGNFIPKLWDINGVRAEVEHLQSSVHSHESISALVESLHDCKDFDHLFEELKERLQRDFGIQKLTLLTITSENDYSILNSNFFSIDTISKLILKRDSKLIALISQVTGMYKIENFESYSELTSQISSEELANSKEFIAFPLIHLGKLYGILVVHEIMAEWTPEFKQTIIHVSNMIAPIVANLLLQKQAEVFLKNPFNPVQDIIEKAIAKAKETNEKFTLVVLKVLSVTRILNLLGLEFFRHYMSFLTSKLQNLIQGEDWISRVGEGKFAIFLKGISKSQTEGFFSSLKQELMKFPNPPKDFKLSIQLYSLTFPDQAEDKRKFIELIEDT
jgi:GGDEF domain-containing protein